MYESVYINIELYTHTHTLISQNIKTILCEPNNSDYLVKTVRVKDIQIVKDIHVCVCVGYVRPHNVIKTLFLYGEDYFVVLSDCNQKNFKSQKTCILFG